MTRSKFLMKKVAAAAGILLILIAFAVFVYLRFLRGRGPNAGKVDILGVPRVGQSLGVRRSAV